MVRAILTYFKTRRFLLSLKSECQLKETFQMHKCQCGITFKFNVLWCADSFTPNVLQFFQKMTVMWGFAYFSIILLQTLCLTKPFSSRNK
jgi:hypothetical protein